MRKTILAALLACAATAPAHAGDQLWQNINSGMTVAEVQALYPEGKSEGRNVEWHPKNTELHGFLQIGDCKPRVEIMHPKGIVEGVTIWMRPAGILKKMCVDEARDAVMAKFGPPMTNEKNDGELFGVESDEETMRWVTDTMAVTWWHETSYDAWHIEYRTRGTQAASGL